MYLATYVHGPAGKGLDLFAVTPQGIDLVAANACKKGVTTTPFVNLATYVHRPAAEGA